MGVVGIDDSSEAPVCRCATSILNSEDLVVLCGCDVKDVLLRVIYQSGRALNKCQGNALVLVAGGDLRNFFHRHTPSADGQVDAHNGAGVGVGDKELR